MIRETPARDSVTPDTRTTRHVRFGSNADLATDFSDVRYGPEADIALSAGCEPFSEGQAQPIGQGPDRNGSLACYREKVDFGSSGISKTYG